VRISIRPAIRVARQAGYREDCKEEKMKRVTLFLAILTVFAFGVMGSALAGMKVLP
jgi:hypothetical protein